MVLVVISEFMQDEIYLNKEVPYYHGFDRVLYYSVKGHIYSNKPINLPAKVEKGEQDIFYKDIVDRITCLCSGVFSSYGLKEFAEILKTKNFNNYVIKNYSLFTAKAKLVYRHIRDDLARKKIGSSERILFYTYRFGFGTLAAILLRKKYINSKIISRVHGQDLFLFRNKYNYLPYRKTLFNEANRIYCISEDGKKYISKIYPSFLYKCRVSRLGTIESKRNTNLSNESIIIVSCSRISRIKRLDLLAKALCNLSMRRVEWIHFGNGDETYKNEICQIIKNKKNDLKVEFRGFVDNDQLHSIYQEMKAMVFINVSESEGLPVSIMEAESVGMPIIATNVGGTREAIEDGCNGILLNANPTVDEINSAIAKIGALNKRKYNDFCNASFNIWNMKFNEKDNYEKFSDDILSVAAGSE